MIFIVKLPFRKQFLGHLDLLCTFIKVKLNQKVDVWNFNFFNQKIYGICQSSLNIFIFHCKSKKYFFFVSRFNGLLDLKI